MNLNNEEYYTNLNKVTLYKAPLFNNTDTILFRNATERDNYFNSLTDKLVLTDFTDLYEGRAFNLPGNYNDLQKYNVMKLYYNDGLGHTNTYYCIVDNYLYVSTDVSCPIYRIDYFLTYGHLLYNKNIPIYTERRTVKNNYLTKLMKSDEMTLQRASYSRETINKNNTVHQYFIIYLNNSIDNTAKSSHTFHVVIPLGYDDNMNLIAEEVTSYTIGAYLCICDEIGLANRLKAENNEYIQKICEINVDPQYFMESGEYANLSSNHYAYLTQDTYIPATNAEANFIVPFPKNYIPKLYDPEYKHNILNRQPYSSIVVQGNEFDSNDFDSSYITYKPEENITRPSLEPGLCIINCYDRIFAIPIGYKGERIAKDYVVTWEHGREFSYTLDYANSLAFKQQTELNAQASATAVRTAGTQMYYQQQLNLNANQQLDVQKALSMTSFQSQINQVNQQSILEETNYNMRQKNWVGRLTETIMGVISSPFDLGTSYVQKEQNRQLAHQVNQALYNTQATSLTNQMIGADKMFELQKSANNINTMFQCDCIAIARDNTLANIAISNKYNRIAPGAYKEADYSDFSNYYYTYKIDTLNGTDYTQYNNYVNYYNIYGIYIGAIEDIRFDNTLGCYYDYVKGSFFNINNNMFEELHNNIFIALAQRITEGIRMWHLDQIDNFGKLTLDNSEEAPEPYNTFTDEEKSTLNDYIKANIYDYSKSGLDELIDSSGYSYTEKNFLKYLNSNYKWGRPISEYTSDELLMLKGSVIEMHDLPYAYDRSELIEYVKENYSIMYTINESQYLIDFINETYHDNPEDEEE